MTTTLKIEGMTCGHCVRAVKSAIEAVPGVSSADVQLENGLARVEHESSASPEAMVQAVEEEGYSALVA